MYSILCISLVHIFFELLTSVISFRNVNHWESHSNDPPAPAVIKLAEFENYLYKLVQYENKATSLAYLIRIKKQTMCFKLKV